MSYRPEARRFNRQCQMDGCADAALHSHLFCQRHAITPEGVAFYHEVQAAARALNTLDDIGSEDEAARRERAEQFGRRVKRGKFNGLLDKAMTSIIEEAAEREAFDLELGALRFALTRTLTEETDAHRMSLSVARLANAVSRLSLAHYATRDPKPVVRFGEKWTPPLGSDEGVVHYIWRHRPADFEERYLMPVDSNASSTDENLARQIRADYEDAIEHNDGPNEDGRYGPLPLPATRRKQMEHRQAELQAT